MGKFICHCAKAHENRTQSTGCRHALLVRFHRHDYLYILAYDWRHRKRSELDLPSSFYGERKLDGALLGMARSRWLAHVLLSLGVCLEPLQNDTSIYTFKAPRKR